MCKFRNRAWEFVIQNGLPRTYTHLNTVTVPLLWKIQHNNELLKKQFLFKKINYKLHQSINSLTVFLFALHVNGGVSNTQLASAFLWKQRVTKILHCLAYGGLLNLHNYDRETILVSETTLWLNALGIYLHTWY